MKDRHPRRRWNLALIFLPLTCGVRLFGEVEALSREEVREYFSTPDPFDIEYPEDVEPDGAVVSLGKELFFDKLLSYNETQSCATCHNPDHGFSDGLRFSLGANGEALSRNTPHLYNLAWNVTYFWDGRSESLEAQALEPIRAEGEMNLPLDTLLERLRGETRYAALFKEAFGDSSVTLDRVGEAIASFERSIVVDDTPFDRYLRGDENAISAASKRGMALFVGKAACIKCHDGPNFTDNSYHNIGVTLTDGGRGSVVGDDTLTGAFKVPGLRNILYSSPYMHDGSLGTLEEVVRFYNQGGRHKEVANELIHPLKLTEDEIRDLVSFLGSLNQPYLVDRPDHRHSNSLVNSTHLK